MTTCAGAICIERCDLVGRQRVKPGLKCWAVPMSAKSPKGLHARFYRKGDRVLFDGVPVLIVELAAKPLHA